MKKSLIFTIVGLALSAIGTVVVSIGDAISIKEAIAKLPEDVIKNIKK